MTGRHRLHAAVMAALVFLAQAATAAGGTLSLDTGRSLALQQGSWGVFNFTATTGAEPFNSLFLAWNISFQVVPTGAVSGTLLIGSGTAALPITSEVGTLFDGALIDPLTAPPTNPVFTPATGYDASQPSVNTLANSAVINGLTTYVGMAATAVDDYASLASATSYTLASVSFTASGDAEGSWAVYAVQQQGAVLKTYWFDENLADMAFANMPFDRGGNYAVQIGTITVAPVPEPSGLMLGGSALVAAGWFGWRRSRGEMAGQRRVSRPPS